MAGVILENISTKKLVVICIFLLSLSLASFIIGGTKVPKAVHTQTVIGTWCRRQYNGTKEKEWYPSRDNGACRSYQNLPPAEQNKVTASDITFSFQYPLKRDDKDLKMSKWFMYHVTVLSFKIVYDELNNPEDEAPVDLLVKVGYRDGNTSDWNLVAENHVDRRLICQPPPKKEDGYMWDCEYMDFFEIGNMFHEEYLVNIRLPPNLDTGSNLRIGKLTDLELVWFAQTGGFTLYSLVLKTVCFALVLPLAIWNWKRVADLNRSPVFLEKLLLAVAVSAIILNFPVDWFMLVVEMKFLLLWSDIRQGIFLSILLIYWLVFTGEHVVDGVQRGSWTHYWKQLATVILASSLMFIFDICERGVRMSNPFFSLWATPEGIQLGKVFVGIAIASSIIYFIILLVFIIKAIYNIWSKRQSFKSMAKGLRIHHMSVIYRFFFALIFSAVCCMLTVVAFAMGQFYESEWKWDLDGDEFEIDEEYSSPDSGYLAKSMKGFEINTAFQLGVYATWNVYVMAMLIFYAPSHKQALLNVSVIGDEEDENDEHVELTRLSSGSMSRSRSAAAASIEQTDECTDESVNLTTGRSVITEAAQIHTLSNRAMAD